MLQPPGTKGSANVKGFDRAFRPAEIVSSRAVDKKHYFLMKWQECDFKEWVEADIADILCPRMVIEFYERFLQWKEDPDKDTLPVTPSASS